MDKRLILLVLIYFTISLKAVEANDRFAWLTIGATSGDLGIYPSFTFGYKPSEFAVEFGGVAYFGGMNSYPVPHNNFTLIGKSKTGSLGIDGLYFFDLNKKMELFGGFGIYLDQISNIADSNVTGMRYSQDTNYKLSPALSGGINFIVPNNEDSLSPIRKHFHSFGFGYHTIRGINLIIMFRIF